METISITAPSTATIVPTGRSAETDTHRNVSLAFEEMQKIPNFKLRNNVKRLHRITKSDY
jgi:hypothetical protein